MERSMPSSNILEIFAFWLDKVSLGLLDFDKFIEAVRVDVSLFKLSDRYCILAYKSGKH